MPLLQELVADVLVIIAASVAVIVLSHALRLSAIVGFLLTGMLIGPSGLGLIRKEEVELLAEIGVVILLFTIGLEFSLAHLRQNWRPFLVGGGLQVALTTLAVAGIAAGFDLPPANAIFLGFLAALSSTAIVLKAYADRRELQAPQGTLVAGILLFQDFSLAPMIILIPVLAGTAEASMANVLLRLGLGILVVTATFLLARLVTPRLLHFIVRTRVREIFLLGALGACLAMSMLTARLGMSMALGAFLAGLILSESEYSHQVTAEVLPFRDFFNSLFFISIGMLLSFEAVQAQWRAILGLGVGILVLKFAITAGVVVSMRFPARIAVIAALSLAQIGEFSFVLGGAGLHLGLLDASVYQLFLGASIFTMLATPALIQVAPRIGQRTPELRLPRRLRRRAAPAAAPSGVAPRSGHVILVGYGLNGRNVSRVLHETAVPFVVLELNGELVRRARADGMPVVYGDATRLEPLEACGIHRASMLVLAISDLVATRHAIRLARVANADLHILARTRAVHEIDELYHLGADDVIPEEFETSVEIFCRVLQQYHVPRNIIEAQVRIIRGEGYSVLRGASLATTAALDRIAEILEATLTDTFLVRRGSPADGASLHDLDLRRETGVTVVAVVRDGQPMTELGPETALAANDTLVLVGNHAALEAAFSLLGGSRPAPPRPAGTPQTAGGDAAGEPS